VAPRGRARPVAPPRLPDLRGHHRDRHAHHIAERYGLLVIITLGEVILFGSLAAQAPVCTWRPT